MNKITSEAFEVAKAEISQAGSFIPVNRVLEILENLRAVVEAVDKAEGGGNAEYTEADVTWLDSLHDRGLTLGVTKTGSADLKYTVYYNGQAVGMGSISDEGLKDTARDIKIMKLIKADDILQMFEENV